LVIPGNFCLVDYLILTTFVHPSIKITKIKSMKNKLFILIGMLGFAGITTTQSQMLSPVVLSSSGGFAISSNVMLSYTIAEMTMVQTAISSGNILTQGFQQPEGHFVSIPESPVIPGKLFIYPNPTNGNFTINYLSNERNETTIKLYDFTGQLVLTKNIPPVNGITSVNFDISSLSQGIYILSIPLVNAKGEKKTEFHKINLIY
jgi:hypothetical protein